MMIDNLVVKLQNGDKSAFRPIVEEYQAEIRTLIACNGICLTDVDDIAQDTFLHVYQKIDTYKPGTNFSAWIRTIAIYKTKAFLEEQKRILKNKNMLVQHYIVEQTLLMTNEQKEDRLKRLKHCIELLGNKAKTLLQKRYEGIPLSIIAHELERSVASVKMMLFRIRNQLRNCMEIRS
ncbi:MAG: sigma-70 family RNA polymerase sigma factor [Sedimentisphaerales bacterium]|nr:sigma-70 family RNA polymerase sigma factor [Sedimentisphaerales bacterium]